MNTFKYYQNINDLKTIDYTVILSNKLGTEKDLISELAIKLNFPKYFSYNWDSLYDCLRDLSWIEARSITIVHSDLPKLNDIDLKIYLEVLMDSLNEWIDDDIHDFYIFFPKKYFKKIDILME